MSDDDLTKPLGAAPKRRFTIPKIPPGWVPRGIYGAIGALVVFITAWTALVDDPYGGEPMAIVSMGALAKPTAAAKKPEATAGDARPNTAATPAAAPGQTITIIDGSTGRRQEVIVTPSGEKPAKPPRVGPGASVDPKLLEPSRHGQIPKIGPDGARPFDVYASAAKPPPAQQDWPKIAIVVEGLGIGANTTSEALAKLPAPVSFSFVPYGTDLDRWVTRARTEGHETLIQVGMEPFDYPDNDPGPQTLLTSMPPENNVDRLQWFLSRAQGYVGISSLMGQRFTATDNAIAPVLREVGKRGLIYFDSGISPRSVAGQFAGSGNVAFVRADEVLDSVPKAGDIDLALARLEATARERGSAVGSASALPVTIDRLAQWARNAEERGIALVPISAVAKGAKAS